MPQILKQDKIGTLSHNTGVITLTPSVLTIGGQQYSTSALTRTITDDVTLAANTRYQVFVVISGGTPAIRISTNENSVGPAGFNGWKLVGSFFTNSTSQFAIISNLTQGLPLVKILLEKNSGTHTNNDGLQVISNWTKTKDDWNCFDATTGIFTAPRNMTITASCIVEFVSNFTGYRGGAIYHNSNIITNAAAWSASLDSTGSAPMFATIDLIKGDTVRFEAFQSSGGNLNYATTDPITRCSITETPDFQPINLEDL